MSDTFDPDNTSYNDLEEYYYVMPYEDLLIDGDGDIHALDNFPVEPHQENYEGSLLNKKDENEFYHNILFNKTYPPIEKAFKEKNSSLLFELLPKSKEFFKIYPDKLLLVHHLAFQYYHSVEIFELMIEHQLLTVNKDSIYIATLYDNTCFIRYGYEHTPHLFENDKLSQYNLLFTMLKSYRFVVADYLLSIGYSIDHFVLSDLDFIKRDDNTVNEKEIDMILYLYDHISDRKRLIYFIQDCPKEQLREWFKLTLLKLQLNEQLPEQATIFQPKL